jgi:hypothetical protein
VLLSCSQPKEEPDDSPQNDEAADDLSSAKIEDPANYQEVFKSRNRLGEFVI